MGTPALCPLLPLTPAPPLGSLLHLTAARPWLLEVDLPADPQQSGVPSSLAPHRASTQWAAVPVPELGPLG